MEHLQLGASAAYLWGGASDIWYYQKKQSNIVKAFEIMKKYNIPVGICAHRLEPIMFCEKEGLVPDFYMTFMQDVKVPWMAFKVLAAGAIPPGDGFDFAFDSGADFVCAGMFDFQVELDAELASRAVTKSKNRKRRWMA